MEFNGHEPIYLQIADYMRRQIVSTSWFPGEKLPTVRQLGLDLKVNPNTVQRSFSLLEDEGYVESKRTIGRFVTKDQKLLHKLKKEMANRDVMTFLHSMKELDCTKEEILELVEKRWEEMGW